MSQLENFLTTSFQNVRSSKRTDRLHQALLEEIFAKNPELAEFKWVYEYKLKEDAFGGTFAIDIAGFDDSDTLRVVIFAKAMNSNVNKNIKNYANTTIGEAARLYYSPRGSLLDKIIFISVLPRFAPRFDNNGFVTGFDDVESAKGRTNIKNVLNDQYGDVVEDINIYYDIANCRLKGTKQDFVSGITPLNLTTMAVIA